MRFRFRSVAAVLAALALLFTQLAVSAFACPGEAMMSMPPGAQSGAMPGCHEMDEAPSPLCPAHCAQEQQSLDKPHSPVVAPAVLIGCMSWRASGVSHPSLDSTGRRAGLIPPPEPPPAIRNCCLRI